LPCYCVTATIFSPDGKPVLTTSQRVTAEDTDDAASAAEKHFDRLIEKNHEPGSYWRMRRLALDSPPKDKDDDLASA
jgi:hypothetical protein